MKNTISFKSISLVIFLHLVIFSLLTAALFIGCKKLDERDVYLLGNFGTLWKNGLVKNFLDMSRSATLRPDLKKIETQKTYQV